jgi:two-component system phosphate regulon sensor histidine kinase PhoR
LYHAKEVHSMAAVTSSTWQGQIFGVVRRRQTYANLLYLFLAFPLGITYFTLLVTGISLGTGLLVVGIGLVILGLMIPMWWWLAELDRRLAMALLGVEIEPPPSPARPNASLWERSRAYVTYGPTWRRLLFVSARFPLGIVYFVLLVAALTLGLGLLLEPASYVVNDLIYQSGQFPGHGDTITIWGQLITENGTFRWSDFLLLLPSVPAGIAVLIGSLHAFNALAWLDGQFATAMLGASNKERQLAEARATAAQASARATAAEQSQRDLIINAGHELRTPLASIRAHVDALSLAASGDQAITNEQMQRYLAVVARESERLSDLVDDLLMLARGETGQQIPLVFAAVDAAAVTREVCDALAPLAERERKVHLLSQAEPATPVWADRLRLSQVLLNIVRNAILYTSEGGIVAMSVRQRDARTVEIAVADTGIGIAPEDLPHVFDRFYRTDESRARASGGFGLGLSIAHDLVKMMGGTISVTSTVGEGSTFTVILLAVVTQEA